jgi:two-component system, cell cycle sensor histidine kinase and response regulator CckA
MPKTGRTTILVVDDEAEVRKLVCAMASQCGYHVLAAGSGMRALAVHRLFGPIDLLITDVVMQGMSGPGLAERLTHLQPGLKVLYISGYEHSRVVQEYVLGPGQPLLAKPFGLQQLEARLRAILAPAVQQAAT